MAKYSIILPVSNGGENLKQCVSSILQQTLQDFNLIVLDNQSTDGSTEWVKSLKNEKIVLHESAASLSIEDSWARVLTIPKNEYITMIGHDDLLSENYLAVMNELIAKHPGASLYQAHFQLIDSEGKRIRPCKQMAEIETAADFLRSVLTNNFDVFGTGFMVRGKDYERVGGIPSYPNLLFADFELWMELTRPAFKATSQEECFSYRLHQSMTKNSADTKVHMALSRFILYLAKLKQEDPGLKQVIEQYGLPFLASYCKGLSHRLIRTPLKERGGVTVDTFLKECKKLSETLMPGSAFDPAAADKSVRLAKLIDSNSLLRGAFLVFRRLYPKPVFK